MVSIVILAAGKGTRMKSSLPKVLHKISGKEMIYYIIKEAKNLTDDIKVVLYHQKDLIKGIINKYFDNIEFITQDHQNYPGTAGAIREIKYKYDKILVLNGDMPLIKSSDLNEFLDINEYDLSMGIIKLSNPSGYGRVVIEDNLVKKIVEEKDANDKELEINFVNSGIYCFKKDFLEENLYKITNNNAQKEFYLTDIISYAKKILPIYVDKDSFKGINSKLDLAKAEEISQRRIKEELLLNGIGMTLPDTIYIEDGVEFIGECFIENNVTIKGKTIIEESTIKANSIIEDSVIKKSQIGPFARIRPKSVIKNSKIGNFVEVKKSILTGVKAGHLAYLGDSEILDGTNIGAGVITCNYDGKNKYQTKIGQNVFIGSDSQLIAPVKIESNSFIGAGSTVTKDVKSDELYISRAKPKIIKGYYSKFFGKNK